MIPGLSSLIGQDHIAEFLKGALESGRLPHALMLCGPRKSGKLEIAKAFAKAALKSTQEENPNLRVIDLYGEDSGGKVKYVDLIRKEVVDNILFAPFGADYKFYIIAGAGKMPPQAQNALLKSLEEPPEYAVIILLTDDSGKLLPTIRSRAVRLQMKSVDKETIRQYLLSKNINNDKASICASLSQGIVKRAEELAEDDGYIAFAEEVVEVVRRVFVKQSPTTFFYEQIKSFTESMDLFLELLEIIIRDVLVYKVQGREKIESPWPGPIEQIASNCSYEQIGELRNQVAKTRAAMISNVSKDVLMELLFTKIGGSIENTGRSAV